MLERETDIILRILTERTIGSGDAIPLSRVLAAEMPAGIKTYMEQEVRGWLYEDLRHGPSLARVYQGAPEVRHVFRSAVTAACTAYLFPRDQFLSTLDNAVHFLQNYLCRPRWTLQHFTFQDRQAVSDDEIKDRCAYFSDYAYYPRLIMSVLHQKKWKEVSAAEFQRLTRTIDDRIIGGYSARQLALLTKPIFDFLFLTEVRTSDTTKAIPLKPLLVFLHDKGMTERRDHLERLCRSRARHEISLPDLAVLLQEIEDLPPTPPAETREEPQRIKAEDIPADEPVAQPDGEDLGLHQRELFGDPSSPSPSTEESPAPAVQGTDRRNPALSLTFAGMKETRQASPLPDLNSLIDEKQRELFVRAIFGRDSAYYTGVITALNRTTTWHEASSYLQQFYQTNNLDPFSEAVVEFTDTIQQRYQSPMDSAAGMPDTE